MRRRHKDGPLGQDSIHLGAQNIMLTMPLLHVGGDAYKFAGDQSYAGQTDSLLSVSTNRSRVQSAF